MQEKNIIQHLTDLKKCLILPFIVFVLCSIVGYFLADEIVQVAKKPIEGKAELVFLSLEDGFINAVKIAVNFGLVSCLPFLICGVYFFIKDALAPKDQKLIKIMLFLSITLFVLGASFAYYFILPLAWDFFLDFTSLGAKFTLGFSSYINLCCTFLLCFGVAFQFPIVLYLLIRFGIIKTEWLKTKRRHTFLLCFVISAILTPPDAISQIVLGLILYSSFEVVLFLTGKT